MKQFVLYFSIIFSFGLVAQVPSYVPQYGLLGYYPFNGNPNDVSANAANLTNNNAVLTADRFGAANSAYSFNGINQNLINSTPMRRRRVRNNNYDWSYQSLRYSFLNKPVTLLGRLWDRARYFKRRAEKTRNLLTP